jgi:hypothetical protein
MSSTQDDAEIQFRSLARGEANLNKGGGLFFCRNQQAWAAEWRMLHRQSRPEPPLPQVDWATDMVALLVSGIRTTGGYDLMIESIAIDDASIKVRAVESRPGRDAVTTQALTNPYHAVALGAHDGAERLTLRIEYDNYEP